MLTKLLQYCGGGVGYRKSINVSDSGEILTQGHTAQYFRELQRCEHDIAKK